MTPTLDNSTFFKSSLPTLSIPLICLLVNVSCATDKVRSEDLVQDNINAPHVPKTRNVYFNTLTDSTPILLKCPSVAGPIWPKAEQVIKIIKETHWGIGVLADADVPFGIISKYLTEIRCNELKGVSFWIDIASQRNALDQGYFALFPVELKYEKPDKTTVESNQGIVITEEPYRPNESSSQQGYCAKLRIGKNTRLQTVAEYLVFYYIRKVPTVIVIAEEPR